MDASNIYAVCWNNHQNHIKSAFDTLLNCKEFTDVTLCCEGVKLQAHKVVLSACSTYFHDLFKENPCQHPVIILQDVKFENLSNIIKFIYRGEVNVPIEHFQSFLKTAQLLNISGLTQNNSSEEDFQENEEMKPSNVNKILTNRLKEDNVLSTPKHEPELLINNDNVCDNLVNYLFQNNAVENEKIKEQMIKTNKKKRKLSIKRNSDKVNEIVKISDDEDNFDETAENVKKLNKKASINKSTNVCDNNKSPQPFTNDNNEDSDRVCKICGKQFLHKLSLKQHMPSHTGVTECDICGLVLSRKYELKLHLKKRHNIISL